jgi:flagellar biosynthesis/type III secretory pathway ATPase
MTAGKGQRFAIMAGSGVGKSVTLGMIAENSSADINVIALIGERGREVLEFIENDLGVEGLKRSVIVVATSDTSALIRMKAAYVATTIAEYFRDKNARCASYDGFYYPIRYGQSGDFTYQQVSHLDKKDIHPLFLRDFLS